jgi:hypothetical protein
VSMPSARTFRTTRTISPLPPRFKRREAGHTMSTLTCGTRVGPPMLRAVDDAPRVER